jgi:hypothetical protein
MFLDRKEDICPLNLPTAEGSDEPESEPSGWELLARIKHSDTKATVVPTSTTAPVTPPAMAPMSDLSLPVGPLTAGIGPITRVGGRTHPERF